MKKVTLVEGLHVKEVVVYTDDDLMYHTYTPQYPQTLHMSGDQIVDPSTHVTYPPITHLVRDCSKLHHQLNPPTDLFIAYTPEVEELLRIPLRAILENAERDRHAAQKTIEDLRITEQDYELELEIVNLELEELQQKVRSATLWQRLKYLFTSTL